MSLNPKTADNAKDIYIASANNFGVQKSTTHDATAAEMTCCWASPTSISTADLI